MSHRPPSLHRRHYVHRIPQVTALLAAGDERDAERVLLEIVAASERDDQQHGVAPWPYERLAILYRAQRRRDEERSILTRFAGQPHARGQKPAKLLRRLAMMQADDGVLAAQDQAAAAVREALGPSPAERERVSDAEQLELGRPSAT